MWYDDNEYDFIPKPPDVHTDFHLQSPIRPDSRYYFYHSISKNLDHPYLIKYSRPFHNYPKYIQLQSDTFRRSYPGLHDISDRISPSSEEYYGYILSYIYNNNAPVSSWMSTRLPPAANTIMSVILAYCGDSKYEINTHPHIPQISYYYSVKMYWEDIKEEMIKLSKGRGNDWKIMRYRLSERTTYILISRTFCIAPHHENIGNIKEKTYYDDDKYHLFDYEQILMIADTLAARALTLTYLELSSTSLSYLPSRDTVNKVYKIYDKLFVNYGNETYNIIKNYESICYASIMSKTDKLSLSRSFITHVLQDKENPQHEIVHKEIYEVLRNVDYQQIAELHSCYRHWGHPVVDEIGGCKKVIDISTNRPICNPDTIIKISGCLKRQICISFILKYGRWPKCDTSALGVETRLYKYISKHITTLNLYDAPVTLTEWDAIRIIDEMIFDYHVDFTDLIDDKSISVDKTFFQNLFDPSITNIFNSKKAPTSRRVLCEILNRQNIDIQEICDLVRKGLLPLSLYNILLSSKEREIKPLPRLFAMMVLELRLYFCVTEKNIAEKVFPLFPQQSMTSSEKVLTDKLFKISNTNSINSLVILIGIDFKSWNLHWSYNSTYKFFNILDDLFGIPNLYSCTHDIFKKSEVMLLSRLLPPFKYVQEGPKYPLHPQSPYYHNYTLDWNQHAGGFEGIRQKGWTFITIGLLLLIEVITGIKSSIIGQGDNQVCRLEFPYDTKQYNTADEFLMANQQDIVTKTNTFLQVLKTTARDLGLEVKLDETWASDKFMAYGKDIIVSGAFLSQSIKRISRTLPDTNQVYPTLHARVSTLQTAGLSGSQKTYHTFSMYWISQLETLLMIVRDMENLSRKSKSGTIQVVHNRINYILPKKRFQDILNDTHFWEFLLMTNSDIFGLAITNLVDYEYRGHPDPLTGYLTFLEVLDTPIARKIIHWLAHRKYELGDGNLELLYANPSSCNISCVNPVISAFKRDMNNYLKSHTKNVNLKQIFNDNMDTLCKTVCQYLGECKPQYPRVNHEIIQSTPIALNHTFLAKFHSSKTLQVINLRDETNEDVFTIMDKADIALTIDLTKKYLSILDMPSTTISNIDITLLAQDMRDFSWSIPLKGQKVEGVTVPHPLHQTTFKVLQQSEDVEVEYISGLLVSPRCIDNIYNVGSQPVFSGCRTHEKKSGRLMVVPTANRPFQAAIRIEQLRPWCYVEDSNIQRFLDSIIATRTNLDRNLVVLAGGSIFSGSVAHRLNDHTTNKSTLNNMRSNITTHILISTDMMGVYSQGSDNYNIHFQGLIHLLYRRISREILYYPDDTQSVYFQLQFKCKKCLEKYTEDKIYNETTIPIFPNYFGNPLIYSEFMSDDIYQLPITSFIKNIDHHRSDIAASTQLLTNIITLSNIQIWNQGERSSPTVSNFSLQDIKKIGIMPIIRRLALYVVLHYELHPHSVLESFNTLTKEAWGALPDFCLSPIIYPDLVRILRVDGLADLQSRSFILVSKLNGLLVREIKRIFSNTDFLKEKIVDNIYFPAENITLARIIRMWSYSNVLLKLYNKSTHRDICTIISRNSRAFIIDKNLFKEMIELFIYKGEIGTLQALIEGYSIKMSKKPVEAYLRSNATEQAELIERARLVPENSIIKYISHIKLSSYAYVSPTIYTKTISDPYREVSYRDICIGKHLTLNIRTKYRNDHQYRLSNNLSGAHSKYLQIILIEDLDIHNPSICLGDGEGSVSYMMYKLTNREVYYNSLCDRTKLMPHRYEGYVPGSFLREPDKVLGSHLCMTTGGNLIDDIYLYELLRILPDKAGILTMDAEVSYNHDYSVAIGILRAIQIILSKREITQVIYKVYLDSKDLVAHIMSGLHVYYHCIKLVVPIFSSHESNECFIVCTRRNDHPPESPPSKESIYIQDGIEKYKPYLMDVMREYNGVPFQASRMKYVHSMIHITTKFGFHCNYDNSLSRYLGDNWIEGHTDDLVSLLENRLSEVLYYIKHYIISCKRMLEGDTLDLHLKISSMNKPNVHFILDKYLQSIMNITILIFTLELRIDKHNIDKILDILSYRIKITKQNMHYNYHTYLKTLENDINDHQSSNILTHSTITNDYLYISNDIQAEDWFQDYGKYYWKIIGHNKHPHLCVFKN